MSTFNFNRKNLKLDIPKDIERDRDIGILEFNMRLLDAVMNDQSTIVQRINFCNIVHSNLIEFLKSRECVTAFDSENPSPQLYAMIDLIGALNKSIMTVDICLQSLNRTITDSEDSLDTDIIENSANQYIYNGEAIETYIESVESRQKLNAPFTTTIRYEPIGYLEPAAVFNNETREIRISEKIQNLNLDHVPSYKPEPSYSKYDYVNDLLSTTLLFRNPYASYEMVIDFFQQMAENPNIDSILISLYRVAKNSHIIEALKTAASNGKRVYAYLEINARGNELDNIKIYRELIEAGVYVNCHYYGYKVHAKCCAAIALDGTIYYHCGTGNYNEKTANLYIDWQYFGSSVSSVESEIRAEQIRSLLYQLIFESSYDHEEMYPPDYNYVNLLQCFHAMTFKTPGRIRIKCNNLTDPRIIESILAAAEAGCKIQLLIRTAVPMIKHPNVEIRSLIGDYLEHERLYIFGDTNNLESAEPVAIIGSSDLMFRNLAKRIEFLTPVDLTDIPILEETFNADWNIGN